MQDARLLLDMDALALIPKHVRPLPDQLAFESRKLWDPVTVRMLGKQWGEATAAKQRIEQDQRDRTAERKAKGEVFTPVYFEEDVRYSSLLRPILDGADGGACCTRSRTDDRG